jgi:hypothetical protein
MENAMTMSSTMTSIWSKLPMELKLQIAASCDVEAFCALRSTNRQTIQQTYEHFQSLFRHIAILLEPESLQILRGISEYRDLREIVRSISVVITNGHNAIRGKRQRIAKEAHLRMDDLLRKHMSFVKHDPSWIAALAKTLSKFKNFDSLGFIDVQEKQQSLGSWSEDGSYRLWRRLPGVDRADAVNGLGYTKLARNIRLKVEGLTPWAQGWAYTTTYFAPDIQQFPQQWAKVLEAVAKSGKPLRKLRGYRFPGPYENISVNGFEASAPMLQAMLYWKSISAGSKMFKDLTSLSLHLNFIKREPQQFVGTKSLFEGMHKLQTLQLNFLHNKPFYVFADMWPTLNLPELRTLVLAWNHGHDHPLRESEDRDLVVFLRNHQRTLRSLTLAGQWMEVYPSKLPHEAEWPNQLLFKCMRDELALKELRLYTPLVPACRLRSIS